MSLRLHACTERLGLTNARGGWGSALRLILAKTSRDLVLNPPPPPASRTARSPALAGQEHGGGVCGGAWAGGVPLGKVSPPSGGKCLCTPHAGWNIFPCLGRGRGWERWPLPQEGRSGLQADTSGPAHHPSPPLASCLWLSHPDGCFLRGRTFLGGALAVPLTPDKRLALAIPLCPPP